MSLDNQSSNTGFVNLDADEVMVVPTTDKQVLNKWMLEEPTVVK